MSTHSALILYVQLRGILFYTGQQNAAEQYKNNSLSHTGSGIMDIFTAY